MCKKCLTFWIILLFLLSTFGPKVFLAIYKPESARKRPFFSPFWYISGSMGAYLTPLTPSNTTSCPGTPPANSQHTKQFLSRLMVGSPIG
jgi:hypothetical protein